MIQTVQRRNSTFPAKLWIFFSNIFETPGLIYLGNIRLGGLHVVCVWATSSCSVGPTVQKLRAMNCEQHILVKVMQNSKYSEIGGQPRPNQYPTIHVSLLIREYCGNVVKGKWIECHTLHLELGFKIERYTWSSCYCTSFTYTSHSILFPFNFLLMILTIPNSVNNNKRITP